MSMSAAVPGEHYGPQNRQGDTPTWRDINEGNEEQDRNAAKGMTVTRLLSYLLLVLGVAICVAFLVLGFAFKSVDGLGIRIDNLTQKTNNQQAQINQQQREIDDLRIQIANVRAGR